MEGNHPSISVTLLRTLTVSQGTKQQYGPVDGVELPVKHPRFNSIHMLVYRHIGVKTCTKACRVHTEPMKSQSYSDNSQSKSYQSSAESRRIVAGNAPERTGTQLINSCCATELCVSASANLQLPKITGLGSMLEY